MAQSGFTPIQLYRTATASAAPSAGNLADGELAINTNDGRLFYKDSGGVVRTIASSASTSGVFAPGTVSAPGITFTGDTNTGIYSPAADTIAFTEGGVESMRIDASGNVGIGTSSPSTKLHLLTPSATSVALRAGNSVSFAEFQVDASGNSQLIAPGGVQIFNTNGAERMRITPTGNVGIGTSSPASPLEVSSTSQFSGIALTGTGRAWSVGSNSTAVVNVNYQHDAMAFTASGTERMRIDASGNVGIGTSSPQQRLNVGSATGVNIIRVDGGNSANNEGSGIFFAQGGTTRIAIGNSSAVLGGAYNQDALYYAETNTVFMSGGFNERMRINTSGNVGIGTSLPTFRLVAANNSTDGGWLYSSGAVSILGLGGYGGATDGAFSLRYDRAIGATTFNGGVRDTPVERMRIDNVGNVGIGTSSPAGRLHARFDAGAGDGFTGRYIFQTTDQRLTIGTYWQSGVGQYSRIQSSNDAGAANNLLLQPDGGLIGIGVTTPNFKLQLHQSLSPVNYFQITNSSSGSGAGDGMLVGTDSAADAIVWMQENANLKFATNNTERMRITAAGLVGIGTSSPNSALHVAGGSGSTIRNTASAGSSWFVGSNVDSYILHNESATPMLFTTAGVERFRIGPVGQLGVGGANYGTSGQVLTSNGSGAAPSWQSVGGTANGLLLNVQVFTSSGTYTRTAGATRAVVIARGGGGGGSGFSSFGECGAINNGGNGGTTSFGSHVSAAGGAGATSVAAAAGGTGGTGAILAVRGQFGISQARAGGGEGAGRGGTSLPGDQNGVAGVRGGGGGSGNNASVSGGGQGEYALDYITTGLGATETVTIGAGGVGGTTNTNAAGGAGGAGYIIVYEYS